MGRHGGHRENARRARREGDPELPEETRNPDTPVGRRLRPEESAETVTRTTGTGEAETVTRAGFLGSGWTATSEMPEPAWPEDRRRAGRGKKTVLAVAAVTAVLGGTFGGVRLLSGSETAPDAACPPGGCHATAFDEPDGSASLPPEEESPPGDETEPPAEESPAAGESATPAPVTPRTQQHRSGRTPTATPRPEDTRVPRRAEHSQPVGRSGEDATAGPGDQSHIVGPTTGPRHDATETPQATAPPPVEQTPETQPSTAEPAAASVPGAALRVGFGVVRQRQQAYTARLVVAADERLSGLDLSLPVGGEVTSVEGAGWRQDGDTLVIESAEDMDAGERLVLTVTAQGRAETPRTCHSPQGECTVG
ncbi:hypothetical protein GCM10010140_36900 [Streptosporangium pseudovulgare]|uniref:Uncharacterized protein n=1 Tax=Streptosporangium pseudovulgare TaxID=35765 RepID=A0ABQ2QXL7_9ACTN|nr:hypothetical protein GCM10010140_36900 [Streptosporangium pseudovulgare]